MAEHTPKNFGYAHSRAVIEALKTFVGNRKSYIGGGYDFLEQPGEHKAFDAMIELAKKGGHDSLYVDTVKEFAGSSLADFKAALTAINDAGMLVYSLTERNYDYYNFLTIIELIEALEPGYYKNRQSIMAVAMCMVDIDIAVICEKTGLSEADVFQAAADYKREQEQQKE